MKTWAEFAKIQSLVSKIMTNSFKKGRISHAYLFQGSRGTGKENLATLFTKTLFCENKQGIEPCHTCINCKRVVSRNHPDVYWLEPEGKSIKNEQIDALRAEFSYSATEAMRKVYIIKHAETLTVNAANRILKFLEEPNIQTTAILLTENSQSLIPTIRSRCQIIDLKPLNESYFQNKLIELGISHQQARVLSALTNNIDEALALGEDEWFLKTNQLVLEFIEVLLTRFDERYLFMHQSWLPHFKEQQQFQQGLDILLLAFKDILYYQLGSLDAMVMYETSDDRMEDRARFFSQDRLLHILNIILEAKKKLKQHVHSTLVMEQFVLQL